MSNTQPAQMPEKKTQINPVVEELQKSLADLKGYQVQKYCTIGSYLDVMDNRDTWCVGKVLSIDTKGMMTIRFDGWGDKYKETHFIGSKKVDAFKKWTPPYTGGVKTTTRDDFSVETLRTEVSQQLEEMSLLQNEDFAFTDSYKFTQYFRGTLFVFADSLLSYLKPIPEKDIPLCIEFFQAYLRLFLKFLKILPSVLPAYIEAMGINKLLFLVNPKVALAAGYAEIFYAIHNLFAGDQLRCFRFYKNNRFETPPPQISEMFAQKNGNEGISLHDQVLSFLSYFGTLDGFEVLLELLAYEQKISAELTYLLPIPIVKKILDIFERSLPYMNKKKSLPLINELKKRIFERLGKISDKELKDLDIKTVRSISFSITELFKKITDNQIIQEEADRFDIRFAIKLIKCPFLEKKFAGISYLKALTVRAGASLTKQYYVAADSNNSGQSYRRTKLCENLELENFLQALLSPETFHPEILKRSMDVLAFLNEENALLPKHLDMLWRLCENKHEADLVAIYLTIVELAKILPEKNLDLIFTWISALPFENYSELTINLLRDFSLNATASLNSKMWKLKTQSSQQYPNYGVYKLWSSLQDNTKAPRTLINACVDALSEVLQNSLFSSLKEQFLSWLMDNLKNGNSVPQSLQLAIILLKSFSQNSSYLSMGESSAESQAIKLNKEVPIFDAIAKDFEVYLKQIQPKVKNADERIGEECLTGKCTHSVNIDVRLEFMSLVSKLLRPKGKDIGIEQLKRLWKTLVLGAQTPLEKTRFLSWLTRKNEVPNNSNGGSQQVPALEESLIAQILEQILGSSELTSNFTMDREVFDCFKTLFVYVNVRNKAFEQNNQELILVNKYDQIVGKDILWKLSMNCTDQYVLEETRALIVNIHLRKSSKSNEQRYKIWQKLQDQCQEILSQTSSPLVQAHIVLTIKSFLQDIEGRMIFGGRKQEVVITVTMQATASISNAAGGGGGNLKKIIKLPGHASLLKLRKEISREFKIQTKDFDLFFFTRNFMITRSQEEEYCVESLNGSDGKAPVIQIQNLKDGNQNLQEITQFKEGLANSTFSETLFGFLSNSSSEDVVKNAWDVLNLLPKNLKIVKKFQNLDSISASSWNDLLPQNCFRKLLYCLQIICDQFLQDEGKLRKEQETWCQSFLRKGGLRQVLGIYLSMSETESLFEKPFNLFCMSSLIQVIGFFVKYYFQSSIKDFLAQNNAPSSSQSSNEFLKLLVQQTNDYIGLSIKKCEFFFSSQSSSLSAFSSMNQSSFMNTSIIVSNKRVQNDSNLSTNKLLVQTYLVCFIRQSFLLLASCFTQSPQLLSLHLHSSTLSLIFISRGLFLLDNTPLRQQLKQSFAQLIDLDNSKQAHLNFQGMLGNILAEEEQTFQTNCRGSCFEFFQLYLGILESLSGLKAMSPALLGSLQNTLNTLIRMIKTSSVFEHSKKDFDGMLRGAFQCAKQIISMDDTLAMSAVNDQDLASSIMRECLFGMPNSSSTEDLPKCKSMESRQCAFQFLVAIEGIVLEQQTKTSQFGKDMQDPNSLIEEYFDFGHWRTASKSDWNIREELQRDCNCPVGLKNLGCTCYMNSLIQQLFTIKEFSESVLKVKAENSEKDFNPYENVLHQLQQIFAALKGSQRQYYDPRDFCRAFKDLEGEIMNVTQQMDVDEFFSTLMDRLEALLKPSKNEFIIKNVFEGELSNELIGRGGGCSHTSERAESFLALSLPAKGKKNLSECLSSFVCGEMLEGENAFFCEKCDKKVPTLKRQSIKKLPNQLMIVLKRFHFDLDTMQKIKINSYCEFPQKLNLKEFTHQYLVDQDKEKDQQTKKNDLETVEDDVVSRQQQQQEEGNSDDPKKNLPEEYYAYKLRGVVIHQGTSDSGHYYSLIKDFDDDKWQEFNDTQVSQFDISELPNEAFGGAEAEMQSANANNFGSKQSMQNALMNKNAYLLFYEKDAFFDENGKKSNSMIDASLINDPNIAQSINFDNVARENLKMHLNKYLFSSDFLDYTQSLLNALNPDKLTPASFRISKFLLKYYFFCRQRQSDKSNVPLFRKKMGQILKKNLLLSTWLIQNAAHENFLKEIFLDCQIEDMKYLSAGLIIEALGNVSEQDSSLSYELFSQKSVLVQFVSACMYVIMNGTGNDYKQLDQLNRILCKAAECCVHTRRYLISQKLIGRLQMLFCDSKALGPTYPDFNNYRAQQQTELSQQSAILASSSQLQKISSYDEFLENKEKNKKLLIVKKNFTSLIRLHSILLRSVQPFASFPFQERMPLGISPRIAIQIDKDEVETFKLSAYIKRILPLCFRKSARNSFTDSQAYLTTQNFQLLEEILNNWTSILQDAKIDELDIKIYFLFLKKSLLIPDSFQQKRARLVMNRASEFIRGNFKYFYAAQIAIDEIIKFSSLSRLFAGEMQREMQENKEFLKALDIFLQGSSNLYQSLNGRMCLFRDENRQHSLNFQYFQKMNDTIKAQTTQRRQKIVLIQNDKQTTLDYDSDEDDYSLKTVSIGDKIDIRSAREFSTFVVIETIGDMFNAQSEEDKTYSKWMKYDDEDIVEPIKAAIHFQYAVNQLHS